jgi:hypothetical protein
MKHLQKLKQLKESEVVTMIAEIKRNEEKNGIEIYFKVYPLAGTKSTMKKNGFRWNPKKACWYAKYSLDAQAIADIIADTTDEEYAEIAKETGEEVREISTSAKIALATRTARKEQRKAKAKAEVKNDFGVKVGDVFVMSWGYEQTQSDFFQVVALAGKKSVRIVEVQPRLVKEDAVSSMSADRTYDVRNCAKVSNSMWINDNEKGDLKRLKSYAADGKSNPIINMTSYANACLVKEDTIEVYNSWYY